MKRCIYLYLDYFIDGLAQGLAGVLALDAHRADIDLEFRGELTAALRMLDDDKYDQIGQDHIIRIISIVCITRTSEYADSGSL